MESHKPGLWIVASSAGFRSEELRRAGGHFYANIVHVSVGRMGTALAVWKGFVASDFFTKNLDFPFNDASHEFGSKSLLLR